LALVGAPEPLVGLKEGEREKRVGERKTWTERERDCVCFKSFGFFVMIRNLAHLFTVSVKPSQRST
jgi:hypothetical protein